jgi:serine/threonine protein kinase
MEDMEKLQHFAKPKPNARAQGAVTNLKTCNPTTNAFSLATVTVPKTPMKELVCHKPLYAYDLYKHFELVEQLKENVCVVRIAGGSTKNTDDDQSVQYNEKFEQGLKRLCDETLLKRDDRDIPTFHPWCDLSWQRLACTTYIYKSAEPLAYKCHVDATTATTQKTFMPTDTLDVNGNYCTQLAREVEAYNRLASRWVYGQAKKDEDTTVTQVKKQEVSFYPFVQLYGVDLDPKTGQIRGIVLQLFGSSVYDVAVAQMKNWGHDIPNALNQILSDELTLLSKQYQAFHLADYAIHCMYSVTQALNFAHHCGIAHGDLSSANVLCAAPSNIWLPYNLQGGFEYVHNYRFEHNVFIGIDAEDVSTNTCDEQVQLDRWIQLTTAVAAAQNESNPLCHVFKLTDFGRAWFEFGGMTVGSGEYDNTNQLNWSSPNEYANQFVYQHYVQHRDMLIARTNLVQHKVVDGKIPRRTYGFEAPEVILNDTTSYNHFLADVFGAFSVCAALLVRDWSVFEYKHTARAFIDMGYMLGWSRFDPRHVPPFITKTTPISYEALVKTTQPVENITITPNTTNDAIFKSVQCIPREHNNPMTMIFGRATTFADIMRKEGVNMTTGPIASLSYPIEWARRLDLWRLPGVSCNRCAHNIAIAFNLPNTTPPDPLKFDKEQAKYITSFCRSIWYARANALNAKFANPVTCGLGLNYSTPPDCLGCIGACLHGLATNQTELLKQYTSPDETMMQTWSRIQPSRLFELYMFTQLLFDSLVSVSNYDATLSLEARQTIQQFGRSLLAYFDKPLPSPITMDIDVTCPFVTCVPTYEKDACLCSSEQQQSSNIIPEFMVLYAQLWRQLKQRFNPHSLSPFIDWPKMRTMDDCHDVKWRNLYYNWWTSLNKYAKKQIVSTTTTTTITTTPHYALCQFFQNLVQRIIHSSQLLRHASHPLVSKRASPLQLLRYFNPQGLVETPTSYGFIETMAVNNGDGSVDATRMVDTSLPLVVAAAATSSTSTMINDDSVLSADLLNAFLQFVFAPASEPLSNKQVLIKIAPAAIFLLPDLTIHADALYVHDAIELFKSIWTRQWSSRYIYTPNPNDDHVVAAGFMPLGYNIAIQINSADYKWLKTVEFMSSAALTLVLCLLHGECVLNNTRQSYANWSEFVNIGIVVASWLNHCILHGHFTHDLLRPPSSGSTSRKDVMDYFMPTDWRIHPVRTLFGLNSRYASAYNLPTFSYICGGNVDLAGYFGELDPYHSDDSSNDEEEDDDSEFVDMDTTLMAVDTLVAAVTPNDYHQQRPSITTATMDTDTDSSSCSSSSSDYCESCEEDDDISAICAQLVLPQFKYWLKPLFARGFVNAYGDLVQFIGTNYSHLPLHPILSQNTQALRQALTDPTTQQGFLTKLTHMNHSTLHYPSDPISLKSNMDYLLK